MSKLYNLIESQVNTFLRLFMEDENGQIHFTNLLSNPQRVYIAISAVSALIFVVIAFAFGIYLWNQGIAPVFPSVVAPIGNEVYTQVPNPFFQLIITMIALSMVF